MSGRRALVTGGAGFVGTNLVSRLVEDGVDVVVLDNLSRRGVRDNLHWLQATYGRRVCFEAGDVRDRLNLRRALAGVGEIYHLAAQVAVTTSLEEPVDDFAVNAHGTLNLLEEARLLPERPFLLFTSTNKVYGTLPELELELERNGRRWQPVDPVIQARGLNETVPLDFCTPYGCSKGAADQYVLDYAKSYGIRSIVFRMSCIYGPHQHGTEDQGWVAHFLIRALENEQITLYGDGRQVRDLLFVDDLVEAFLAASQRIGAVSGHAFNIGGGPSNVFSLLEMVQLIGEVAREAPPVSFAEPRPSDQLYYVSDTRKFQKLTGWRPRVEVKEGVAHLHAWLKANRSPERVERREAAG